MRIDHIAIWVTDLELMRTFYQNHFGAIAGELYHNPKTEFTSYFLTFKEGCRLELMHKPNIPAMANDSNDQHLGIIHIAISVGTKSKVDHLTEELRSIGCHVVGEPRMTGDGYYESVVLDPENNRIEITE